MNRDTMKTKALIIFISLLAIIPLSVAIITNVNKASTHDEEDSLSIHPDVLQYISDNFDLGDNVFTTHRIAQSDDYLALSVMSDASIDPGNAMLLILREDGGRYETIYAGSDYDGRSLTNLGVPEEVTSKVLADNNITASTSAISPYDKYPLVKKLPFKSDNLSIGYYFNKNIKDSDGTNIPIIKISGTDAAERNNAISKIRKYGYDIGYYPVFFTGVNNPFPVVNEDWKKMIRDEDDDSNLGGGIESEGDGLDDDAEVMSGSNTNYNDEEGP